MRATLAVLGALAVVAPTATQEREPQAIKDLLVRAGAHVADYYARARSVVSRETVRLQPLDRQMRPSGDWRQLVYDLRVEWDPSRPGEPVATRELVSSGGRLGTLPSRDNECFDLRSASADPLAMLLSDRQPHYRFTRARERASRSVVVLDFKPQASERPHVSWNGNCGTIDLNGSIVGRIWIDSATGAVRRIDERLPHPFPYVMPLSLILDRHPVSQTVDRLETSIRYEPVRFRDPDETLLLPHSIRTLSVIQNGGVPQLLTLQTYDRYRRFVTGGRVVK